MVRSTIAAHIMGGPALPPSCAIQSMMRCSVQCRWQVRAMLSLGSTTGLVLFDRRGRLLTADARARAALATLGGGDAAAPYDRLPALDVCAAAAGSVAPLPFWLRSRWLEPVLVGEERIGT